MKQVENAFGDLLSVEQVARRLNCSVRKLRELIRTRSIGCHRIGRRVLLSEKHIADYLKEHETLPLDVHKIIRKRCR